MIRAPQIFLPLLLAASAASATRPIEDTIFKASMPHEQLTTGTKVPVHYVSRRVVGAPGMRDNVPALQQLVRACVAALQRDHRPVNPPTSWPEDSMQESRTDSYYAKNRGITYRHGVFFSVNQADCSLRELESRTATLQSTKGVCEIDLLRKTAHGVCDAHGHADAAYMAPRTPDPAFIAGRTKSNPALAALASLGGPAGLVPQTTGASKTVDGVKCEVMASGGPFAGTACYLRGGAFVPSEMAVETGGGFVMLDGDLGKFGLATARRAKVDALVSDAVFTPYLGQGFTVTADGGGP